MPTGAAGQLEFKHSSHTGLIIENPKEETTPADVRGLASLVPVSLGSWYVHLPTDVRGLASEALPLVPVSLGSWHVHLVYVAH